MCFFNFSNNGFFSRVSFKCTSFGESLNCLAVVTIRVWNAQLLILNDASSCLRFCQFVEASSLWAAVGFVVVFVTPARASYSTASTCGSLLLSIVSHARLLCYCFRALSLRPQPYSIVSLTLGFKRPLQRSKCHEFNHFFLVGSSVCSFGFSFVGFCARLPQDPCQQIFCCFFFLYFFGCPLCWTQIENLSGVSQQCRIIYIVLDNISLYVFVYVRV